MHERRQKTRDHILVLNRNEICNYQFITTRIVNTILHSSHVNFFIHHNENLGLKHALQSLKSATSVIRLWIILIICTRTKFTPEETPTNAAVHLLTKRKVRLLAETMKRRVPRKIQLFFATRRSYKNRNRKHPNIDSVTKTSVYLVTGPSTRRRFTSLKNHISVGSVTNLSDMLVVGKSMRRQSTTKKSLTSVNFVTQVSTTIISEKCMKKLSTSRKNHTSVNFVTRLSDWHMIGKSTKRQFISKKNHTSVNFVTRRLV